MSGGHSIELKGGGMRSGRGLLHNKTKVLV